LVNTVLAVEKCRDSPPVSISMAVEAVAYSVYAVHSTTPKELVIFRFNSSMNVFQSYSTYALEINPDITVTVVEVQRILFSM